MIKFSIIIPVYNKAADIQQCINSILAQTYTNFELVIVNDGSTDNSEVIIQGFKDPRIKYIYKENGGVSSARNRGIKEATGKWITFMDADDIMYTHALSVYNDLINKYPNVGVVAASTDQSNKKYPKRNYDYIVSDYDLCNAISYAKAGFSLVNTDCICIRHDLFLKAGLFNENYTHGEDMDLWKRLSEVTNFAKSDIPIALYRQDTINNSSSKKEKDRKYAPIALIEHPRSYYKGYSSKLLQGERVFFHIFPSLLKSWDKSKARLLFKYFDWTALFACYVVYYRIIKR